MYNGEMGPEAYAEIEKLRNLLSDNYEAVQCPHCQSWAGHFFHCPLINREMAEAKAAEVGHFTDVDKIIAHGLGVQL